MYSGIGATITLVVSVVIHSLWKTARCERVFVAPRSYEQPVTVAERTTAEEY